MAKNLLHCETGFRRISFCATRSHPLFLITISVRWPDFNMKSELNALKKEVEQLKIISDMDLATSSDKNLKKELMDCLSQFKKEFKKIS
jgi:hypothetical protein